MTNGEATDMMAADRFAGLHGSLCAAPDHTTPSIAERFGEEEQTT